MPLGRKLSRVVPLVVVAAIFCGHGSSRADPGPQPPCESAPFPPYPDLELSPAVRAWGRAESGRDWIPPACTRWTDSGFTTLVATTAINRAVAYYRYLAAIPTGKEPPAAP